MTTLLYYILRSRFWQRIVMISLPNLWGEGELRKEGDNFRVNPSVYTKNPLQSNLTPCHGEDASAIIPENGFLEETRFLDIVFWLRVSRWIGGQCLPYGKKWLLDFAKDCLNSWRELAVAANFSSSSKIVEGSAGVGSRESKFEHLY